MNRYLLALTVPVLAIMPLAGCQSVGRGPLRETSLSDEGRAAVKQLLVENEAAAKLSKDAKAVLVFPEVIKGGFMIGGFHGEGVMLKQGKLAGYYNTTGGSYGLQAGIQTYSYALFLMSDEDVNYIENSSGWEIGMGPSVTVVDEGIARSLTTTTGRSGVYCFFFDQKGLMAGLGLQGSKITRIDN